MIETYKTKAPSSWGIVHKHSAKLIGTIGFVSVDRTHSRAEVGFALGRKYWSQGLMTEALGEVLRFSFSDMGLNRVVAKCFVENTGSERVMQKVGMKFEGVCREEALIKGKFVDLKQYAILRSEFI